MSISTSPLSYQDCYSMMDEALADPQGARFRINRPTLDLAEREATFLRMRMHQARSLNRDLNRQIYPDPAHPLHGTSMYDKLTVRIKNIAGEVYVYLEQQALNVSPGEPLSLLPEPEFDSAPAQIEYQPTRQLTDKAVDIPQAKINRRL